MTRYDYCVIGFYFAFMLGISWVFRRFVHNVSDYFRGGGKALWWMVGGSAFMMSFSAWTLTGAASKAYGDGWPIVIIYVANSLGFLINALHFAPKFRQMRVVTGIEAVRLRFGRANEQVFTWLQLPLGTLQATLHLNAVAIFFSAVFGFDLSLTIIVLGIVVLSIALLGGSWAVIAGDFIQMLILMPVCLTITVLALAHLGGFAGFLAKIPAGHLDFTALWRRDFLGLWCAAMLLKQFISTNNLLDANRYLSVKDSRHARWAGFLGSGLYLAGIFIWFVPPMAARALFPDLHGQFPTLEHPDEAAFIAITRVVAPVGMLGLLVSGIFAATMSAMDAGLNKSAGIFIKNFYQPVLRPGAPDGHLLKAGKLVTLVLGCVIILTALKMSTLKEFNLFLQMQRVTILIGVPITVPLVLALIVRRTPAWSGWSTVAVGFAGSLLIDRFLSPAGAAQFFHHAAPDATTQEYWRQGIQLFGNVALGTGWFLFSSLFWNASSAPHRARVETFLERIDRPIDFAAEEGAANANDARQSAAVGWLALTYGSFVMLLALIPNPPAGRVAFLGCGGLVALVGLVLIRSSLRTAATTAARAPAA
ncbi:MAG: sglT 2 [Lacunisphaera sp.]|nr:sglT 2 [Lacunisphaera sp.]